MPHKQPLETAVLPTPHNDYTVVAEQKIFFEKYIVFPRVRWNLTAKLG